MKIFRIDCSKVDSYEDFIEAFNIGMIRSVGGEWNGNLDAFNDYLSWPDDFPYQISLVGHSRCESKLNYKRRQHYSETLWSTITEILRDSEGVIVSYEEP